MCGIVGVVNSDGRLGERELAILNETMRPRGPDGAGLFWEGQTGIAMRRLAIIDLAGGQQPLFSEDTNVVVVMNGEIYNYLTLREQLVATGHCFSTHADTEVLVHGYEQFGIEGLLDRIDGMFAFAIWDRRAERIFLARDRFGEKPLYIAGENGTVLFGSQLLTVVAGLCQTPAVSAESLQLYWALHFVPGSRTIFEGVRRLQAGEACEIDVATGKALRFWRYWSLREGEERHVDEEELADLVDKAVTSRLIADVPVGIYLSGGLDSSLLASVAARHVPGIHTFSIGFDSPRHDESAYAWEVADYIGATHHHFMVDVNDFRDLIPHVVASMDEPVGDQAMLPLFALAREASKVVKVALSGEGADELFAGYSYYSPFATQSSSPSDSRRPTGNNHRGRFDLLGADERTPSGFPLVLPSAVRFRLSPPARCDAESWHEELSNALGAVRDPLRRAQLCDVETWLSADLLMKADKMNMAHSLESRSPYLTWALAEAALNLPTQDKATDGAVKILLRKVALDCLPQTILSRPKQGWVLPMRRWLVDDLFDDFLAAIRTCTEPLIDVSYMATLAHDERTRNGIPVGERGLYALMVLVRWLGYATRQVLDTRRLVSRVANPQSDDQATSENNETPSILPRLPSRC